MFESVLSTNTDAVCLMRRGKLDESMYLLRAVLTAVQEAARREPSPIEGQQGRIASIPLNDGNSVSPFKLATEQGMEIACVDIFDRAFIFEGPQSLANTDDNASLCAAVGLYNMALGMHIKALKNGSSNLLLKASGFYEKVFTIVRSMAPSPLSSVSALFLAAILNKISCENELRGHTATQQWRVLYKDAFGWATQTVDEAIAMDPEDLEVFASNAVLLCSQCFRTAPAA